MEQALRQFLARLEAIDEDFEGLGPEGNRRVGTTIARFVTAARTAAEREAISSFHGRLASFQNDAVRTEDGSNFNDFFRVKDGTWFDAAGNDLR
jgi:hypothetical protein